MLFLNFFVAFFNKACYHKGATRKTNNKSIKTSMSIAKNVSISKTTSKKYVELYPLTINKFTFDSFLKARGSIWIFGCGSQENRRIFIADCKELKKLFRLQARHNTEQNQYQFYLDPAQMQLATLRNGKMIYNGTVTESFNNKYRACKVEWNACLPHYRPSGRENSNINSVGEMAAGNISLGWLSILPSRLSQAAEMNLQWIVDTAILGCRRVYMISSAELNKAILEKESSIDKVRGGRYSLYINYKTGAIYTRIAMTPSDFLIQMEEYQGDDFGGLLSTTLN